MDNGSFRERMHLPWWAWPAALAIVALLATEIHLGAPGPAFWLTYVLGPPVVLGGLLWLGRLPVRVADGVLHVDDAALPVGCIADVESLTGTPLRDALSVGLHPLAFVVQRPWIRTAVRITLDDPDDPTPYWIVSTRRPEELTAALRAAQGAPRPAGEAHPVS